MLLGDFSKLQKWKTVTNSPQILINARTCQKFIIHLEKCCADLHLFQKKWHRIATKYCWFYCTGQCLHVFDLILCSFFIKKSRTGIVYIPPSSSDIFFSLDLILNSLLKRISVMYKAKQKNKMSFKCCSSNSYSSHRVVVFHDSFLILPKEEGEWFGLNNLQIFRSVYLE